MRIAVLAHPRHPIRPPFMGGMEAHVYHLTRELRARGHEVDLFAAGDSEPSNGVRLRAVLPRHYEVDFPWRAYRGTRALGDYLDAAFARMGAELVAGGYDVVHNNTLHPLPPRLARTHRLPLVTSLHVPAFRALREAVAANLAPWVRATATSRSHAASYWPEDGGLPPGVHVVHNGIDASAWPARRRGDGTVVWSGRIARTKAPHLALDAARLAGLPITLYGPVEEADYFAESVRPRLGAEAVYGGHLRARDLAAALASASVFAFTPMWDEPFGLAAVEAMACGLPVASFDRGAAREIVGERAGRFAAAGDVAGLAQAMLDSLGIDPVLPRRRVAERYTIERMVCGYEAAYALARRGSRSGLSDAFGEALRVRA